MADETNIPRELTPEEIAAMENETITFYKRQIEVITPQVEYQRLTTELEELRLRGMMAITRQAQLMHKEPTESKIPDEPTPPGPPPAGRKLADHD
jgi:hypothetical protein